MKYTCPRCIYTTNDKVCMRKHFNRKKPCQLNEDGILELTEEIKQQVLSLSYLKNKKCVNEDVPEKTTQITNNFTSIVNIMINGQCNIMNNQIIVDAITPHVDKLKYGQGKVFDRLNVYQQKVEDTNHVLCEDDVYTMTKDITETRDQRRLTDAYYSFDVKNKTYYIRRDDDDYKWIWAPCLLEDIFSDIVVQLREYVFISAEVKLNNVYTHDKELALPKLIDFYRILKYLLMKPLCSSARCDNQIMFMSSDDEHFVVNGYELCDELSKIFNETQIDAWEMMQCRERIADLIRTNGETTFEMIENLVGCMLTT
jgi:hypothetical protein